MVLVVRHALADFSAMWVWGAENRLLSVRLPGSSPRAFSVGFRQKLPVNSVLASLENLSNDQFGHLGHISIKKPLN